MPNPFSVNPCLFIGIGTNGWRILQELRILFYEEFGRAGLPCFRYIGIESDADRKPDNSFLPHAPAEYETITPVYVSIPDVEVMRRRLDPRRSDAIPGLADWLDTELINRGGKSYKAGAGNARQAGRMCLWENWNSFNQAISDADDAIRKTPKNKDETERFLRIDYFPRKRGVMQIPQDPLVEDAPKVYIFGTLCGGTCSGTFIDVAYFVALQLGLLGDVHRGIRRRAVDPEVVGLFTIVDMKRTDSQGQQVPVANCWAALRELDFLYHSEGRYEVTFPNGKQISTNTEPFDTLYLESLSNLAATGFTQQDYDGLAQMCAMNLFTEAVAGLAGIKSSSRVNLQQTAAKEGYLQPNEFDHIRAFSSFGLSAFWYPKYRIAQAINRQLAIAMCDGWLGKVGETSGATDQAVKDWDDLLAAARDSLVGKGANPQCKPNIEEAIQQAFESGESAFLQTDEYGLDKYLVDVPGKVSFVTMLASPAGEYFSRINNAAGLVFLEVKAALVSKTQEYFRSHTCVEVQAYIEALFAEAKKREEILPKQLNSLSQQMDLSLSHEVHHSWWAKSLGLYQEAVAEYKRTLWRDLHQRVMNHLRHLQDYFVKEIVGKIHPELSNLKASVEGAKARLVTLRETCQREKSEIVNFKPPGHIVILAAGDSNTIAEDVDLGYRQVFKDMDRGALRQLCVNEADPLALLTTNDGNQLMSRIDHYFGKFSQNVTGAFQIGQKVLALASNRMPGLVDRAAPYIEPIGSYKEMAPKDAPVFVFSSDSAVAKDLAQTINQGLRDPRYKSASSPLDHFVIFYHEAVGLALSDLAICNQANTILTELERAPARIATYYTHKNGEKMFNFLLVRDVQRMAEWIGCLKYLAPDLFTSLGKDLCLTYKKANGLSGSLAVDDPQALRQFLEDEGAESLLSRFRERLKALGRDDVLKRMEARRKQVQSVSEEERVNLVHARILHDVFP